MKSSTDLNLPVVARRLNPFAFPVETDARFRLLLASAVALTFAMSFILLEFTGWIGPIGTLFLLWGLTVYFYRQHPAQIRRQKGLVPADAQKDAALLSAVTQLATDAGVAPLPQIELGPQKNQDGQAFGFAAQPILRLGGGLHFLRLKKPAFFQAIVVHELAHLLNRDVQRTYWSQALWQAFLVVICLLAPLHWLFFFLGSIDSGLWLIFAIPVALAMTLLIGIQIGLIILLVTFIRRGVLHVREYYADWRAAVCGAEAGMLEILQQPRAEPTRSRWQRLMRFHPSVAGRYAVLINPAPLFRVNRELPFTAGILTGVLFTGTLTLLLWFYFVIDARSTPFSLLTGLAILISLGSLFFFVGLLIDTVGLQVMRESIADLAYNQRGFNRYMRLLMPALLMAIGFQLGPILVPDDSFTAARPQPQIESSLAQMLGLFNEFLVTQLLLGIALTFVNWIGLAMMRSLAQSALQRASDVVTFGRQLQRVLLGPRLWFCAMYLLVLSFPLLQNEKLTLQEGQWIAVIALIVSAFVLISIGLGLVIHRISGNPHCPKCGEKIDSKLIFTSGCRVCSYDSVSWLFVDPLAQHVPLYEPQVKN